MAAKSDESLLANLLVGLLEIVLNLLLFPVYLFIGALSIVTGGFVVFVIVLLLLALMILCGLTGVAL